MGCCKCQLPSSWKVIAFTLNMIVGLGLSQLLGATMEESTYDTWMEIVTGATMWTLSFIMIGVGYEFTIDKSNLWEYVGDYLIAMTAAGFPWLFVGFWFFLFLGVDLPFDECLLIARFAAPTSAGILFSMLDAAGLKDTWVFQKARILAIFDDLDTIIFMIPLKVLMVGFKWELTIVIGLMAVLLTFSWVYLHRLRLPCSWSWTLVYAGVIAAICKIVYWYTHHKIHMDEPIHIEVLLPAFCLGTVIDTPCARHELKLQRSMSSLKQARRISRSRTSQLSNGESSGSGGLGALKTEHVDEQLDSLNGLADADTKQADCNILRETSKTSEPVSLVDVDGNQGIVKKALPRSLSKPSLESKTSRLSRISETAVAVEQAPPGCVPEEATPGYVPDVGTHLGIDNNDSRLREDTEVTIVTAVAAVSNHVMIQDEIDSIEEVNLNADKLLAAATDRVPSKGSKNSKKSGTSSESDPQPRGRKGSKLSTLSHKSKVSSLSINSMGSKRSLTRYGVPREDVYTAMKVQHVGEPESEPMPENADKRCPKPAQDHGHADEHVWQERVETGISLIFMVLVGLSMPALLGKNGEDQSGGLGGGTIAFHVFSVSVLMIVGKMFPLFCYSEECNIRGRLALCMGMCPRGEVGASIIVISLDLGVSGPAIIIAIIALAGNLIMSGGFIAAVKTLLKDAPAYTLDEMILQTPVEEASIS